MATSMPVYDICMQTLHVLQSSDLQDFTNFIKIKKSFHKNDYNTSYKNIKHTVFAAIVTLHR